MDISKVVEVGIPVLTIAATTLLSMYHMGRKVGIVETKLDAVADDVRVIRTNELFHITKRVENVERVLMGDKFDRED